MNIALHLKRIGKCSDERNSRTRQLIWQKWEIIRVKIHIYELMSALIQSKNGWRKQLYMQHIFFLLKHERKYKFEDVEILHDLMSEQQEHSPELQFRGEGLMNCGYNCLCMPVATGLDCPSYERIGMLTYNIHEVQFGFIKLWITHVELFLSRILSHSLMKMFRLYINSYILNCFHFNDLILCYNFYKKNSTYSHLLIKNEMCMERPFSLLKLHQRKQNWQNSPFLHRKKFFDTKSILT